MQAWRLESSWLELRNCRLNSGLQSIGPRSNLVAPKRAEDVARACHMTLVHLPPSSAASPLSDAAQNEPRQARENWNWLKKPSSFQALNERQRFAPENGRRGASAAVRGSAAGAANQWRHLRSRHGDSSHSGITDSHKNDPRSHRTDRHDAVCLGAVCRNQSCLRCARGDDALGGNRQVG